MIRLRPQAFILSRPFILLGVSSLIEPSDLVVKLRDLVSVFFYVPSAVFDVGSLFKKSKFSFLDVSNTLFS